MKKGLLKKTISQPLGMMRRAGIRRVAAVLLLMLLTTATTMTAQTITMATFTYDVDGVTPNIEDGGTAFFVSFHHF